jgi:polyisoprenoid-binding protein YceI
MLRLITAVIVTGCLANGVLAADIEVSLTGENTKISFVGSKPGGKHEGGFKKLTGSAKFDPADASTLKLSVEIDMNSTFTDTEKLTGHLKSADFFNVKNNPTAKFVSTKVEKATGGYEVTGNFTLAGKTKTMSFLAKIEPNADGITVSSNFSIDRNDWGISYGKGKIDDRVQLTINLRAKK